MRECFDDYINRLMFIEEELDIRVESLKLEIESISLSTIVTKMRKLLKQEGFISENPDLAVNYIKLLRKYKTSRKLLSEDKVGKMKIEALYESHGELKFNFFNNNPNNSKIFSISEANMLKAIKDYEKSVYNQQCLKDKSSKLSHDAANRGSKCFCKLS